jgi:hypothetical protein
MTVTFNYPGSFKQRLYADNERKSRSRVQYQLGNYPLSKPGGGEIEMALSLTREQFMERLKEPHRTQLLAIALLEDIKQAFPADRIYQVPVKDNNTSVFIDISDPMMKFMSNWFLRIVDLAYDENLDVEGQETVQDT